MKEQPLGRPERFILATIDAGSAVDYTLPIVSRAIITTISIFQEQLAPTGDGNIVISLAGVKIFETFFTSTSSDFRSLELEPTIMLPGETLVADATSALLSRFYVNICGYLYWSLD